MTLNPLQRILAMTVAEQRRLGLVDTPREIEQQPRAWLETAEVIRRTIPELQEFMAKTRAVPGAPLILCGAGTSHYIGLSLEGFFRSHGVNARAAASTEVVVDPNDALPRGPFSMISFARSGNSPEGIGALEYLMEHLPSVNHLVITCNPSGQLYQLAVGAGLSRLLLPPMTNDQSLVMTSSYSSMVIAGQSLVMIDRPDRFYHAVAQMAAMAERVLAEAAAPLAALAERPPRQVCFLGSGTLLGAAYEACLKVLEMTAGRVLSRAESFLGLRHGPMAAIDQETLIVAFLSADPIRRRYELDLLQELREKRLGGQTVVVADSADQLGHLADLVVETGVPGPPLDDQLRPPVYVVAAQLLGLFLSLEAGLAPDLPSSGVIHRVVQGVRIYDRRSTYVNE